MRDFHLPGRSTVHSTEAMAATSHPQATLAALDILRAGGNAVDAAVAAAAMLAVVEPQSTGPGGDVFMLYSPGGKGDVIGYNGSGCAPAGLSAEHLIGAGLDAIPLGSPHSVTIPGAVEAWERLTRDHGRKPLGEILAPAIRTAEEGYVIAPRVARDMKSNEAKLAIDPNARRVFLPGGKAMPAGTVHRQPELGATLREIAKTGAAGFYRGWVAEDIVAHLRALGGTHTMEDFAAYRGHYVAPIATTYRGHDCLQIPPNGQGVVALLMLNILAGYDLAKLDPLGVDRLHLTAEASVLAYALRDQLVADPAQASVPVAQLLDSAFAETLRRKIDPKRAMTAPPPGLFPDHRDTVYLTVVDRDRNACSFINSTFHNFGSGLVAPKSGVVLQNRGAGFLVKPGHPNCVAPGKRPLHTIIPGMVKKNGKVTLSYGVMGGQYQPVGHAWLLNNLIDFGMDVQEAIDLPRAFLWQGSYGLERGIPDVTARGLVERGHKIDTVDAPHGGGQAIAIDWERGTLTGASDPRKDGCALGY
ncbi:MAG: gamma-glutamyltransferase [Alphaproteobacteria bacterium]|nr:gamma-glutamyltransferase [Alphaproteobacteria bacterium]